jgi:hypothetical protein
MTKNTKKICFQINQDVRDYSQKKEKRKTETENEKQRVPGNQPNERKQWD